MDTPLRVGRLPFLVCAPFFHSTLRRRRRHPTSWTACPASSTGSCRPGRIDCAPSSSFEYGLHLATTGFSRAVSTSSTMEMKSVLVPFPGPLGRPGRRRRGPVRRLRHLQRAVPHPVRAPLLGGARDLARARTRLRGRGAEGRVFIGDRALAESLSGRWPHRYDLADVWARWQDLPFSFGLWMVRRDALQAKAALVSRFHRILLRSLAAFRAGSRARPWTPGPRPILPPARGN